ncbi:MAG: hypothetical protein ACYDEV_04345 [Acidiferrobacter sp.]
MRSAIGLYRFAGASDEDRALLDTSSKALRDGLLGFATLSLGTLALAIATLIPNEVAAWVVGGLASLFAIPSALLVAAYFIGDTFARVDHQIRAAWRKNPDVPSVARWSRAGIVIVAMRNRIVRAKAKAAKNVQGGTRVRTA